MLKCKLLAGITLMLLLTACGGKQSGNVSQQGPGVYDTLIEASHAEKPPWIYEEPEPDGDRLGFTGVSGIQSTEQLAREDARRFAATAATAYTGQLVKDRFQRARISYGLASDVQNPTTSAKAFEKQLASNMISKMKVKSWYIEKRKTQTGVGHKAYCLAYIPQGDMQDAYENAAADMAKKAQDAARKANTQTAKEQLENASQMWQQMKAEGLFED